MWEARPGLRNLPIRLLNSWNLNLVSRPPPRLRTLDIGEVFFFRVDQTLEVTLAMEAGLTDHVWSWRNWWDYWNDRKCGQRHEMAILDRLICQRIDGASLCHVSVYYLLNYPQSWRVSWRVIAPLSVVAFWTMLTYRA